MVQREGRYAQRKDVALNQSGCEKNPWISYCQRRHKGQIRDENLAILGPLLVMYRQADEGLKQQRNEQYPRYWRYVQSWKHQGRHRRGCAPRLEVVSCPPRLVFETQEHLPWSFVATLIR